MRYYDYVTVIEQLNSSVVEDTHTDRHMHIHTDTEQT